MSVAVEYWPVGRVTPYESNPRINDQAVQAVAASIRDFGFRQPIVVDADGVIIAGHTRLKAAKALGMDTVPVIVAADMTPDQARAYRLADNKAAELAEWDYDALAVELDALAGSIDMGEYGFDAGIDFSDLESMMGEKDEEYQAFVDKFKPKHTTDDCFTPPEVYEAVKQWVAREYGHTGEIVRPFYPGGDYTAFDYPPGCLVLDNPPFSIQAEIDRFYVEHGIDFFLFANGLTVLNNLREGVDVVIPDASITYENGAVIRTAFVTNLGDDRIRVSASLHDAVEEAQPVETADLNAYEWPDNLVTSAMLGRLASYGSEFAIRNIEPISKFDDGTPIYGKGALVSDAMAEKVKAEKVKAEKVKAEKVKIKVELSDRERGIVEELNRREAL